MMPSDSSSVAQEPPTAPVIAQPPPPAPVAVQASPAQCLPGLLVPSQEGLARSKRSRAARSLQVSPVITSPGTASPPPAKAARTAAVPFPQSPPAVFSPRSRPSRGGRRAVVAAKRAALVPREPSDEELAFELGRCPEYLLHEFQLLCDMPMPERLRFFADDDDLRRDFGHLFFVNSLTGQPPASRRPDFASNPLAALLLPSSSAVPPADVEGDIDAPDPFADDLNAADADYECGDSC